MSMSHDSMLTSATAGRDALQGADQIQACLVENAPADEIRPRLALGPQELCPRPLELGDESVRLKARRRVLHRPSAGESA
jgi:hypothetical protein